MSTIKWLEEWYKSQSVNDWQHFYGVKIETLDNPGWVVTIDLADTALADKTFEEYEVTNSDDDWIHCRVNGEIFEGCGDSSKLEEIIIIFKNWAEKY